MSWWEGKEKVREYLEEVNAGGQVGLPTNLFIPFLEHWH
jgi:hypothetical protein